MNFVETLLLLSSYGAIIALLWYRMGRNDEKLKSKDDNPSWKDVDNFIRWYLADDHSFDVLYNGDNEPDGFINLKTGKSYTHRELFDYYIKYVKQ